MTLKDHALGVPHGLPPEVAGRQQVRVAVLYMEIDRRLGAALDDEFIDTVDLMQSIWFQNQAGVDRWRKIRNDYSSIYPSSGGFLVSERLRAELLRVALESVSRRPRAPGIPM